MRGFVPCSECFEPVPIAGPEDKTAGVRCLACADGVTEPDAPWNQPDIEDGFDAEAENESRVISQEVA
jgi:hypothetical protein